MSYMPPHPTGSLGKIIIEEKGYLRNKYTVCAAIYVSVYGPATPSSSTERGPF
jgi:hypothetical protein